MAQPQEISHDSLCLLLKPPRFFPVKLTAGTVEPHNRRKHAKLRPPRLHFVILIASHMASDVVAPPAITDIRGIRSKIRLKFERVPCCDRIAGKSHRIPVASRSRIPRKRHWPLSVSPAVQKMVMVQHPQRIQSGNSAVPPLLPVNPPEIHSHFFIRMMKVLKIRFEKIRIRNIKAHRIFMLPVYSQIFSHILIHLFISLNPIRRVDI